MFIEIENKLINLSHVSHAERWGEIEDDTFQLRLYQPDGTAGHTSVTLRFTSLEALEGAIEAYRLEDILTIKSRNTYYNPNYIKYIERFERELEIDGSNPYGIRFVRISNGTQQVTHSWFLPTKLERDTAFDVLRLQLEDLDSIEEAKHSVSRLVRETKELRSTLSNHIDYTNTAVTSINQNLQGLNSSSTSQLAALQATVASNISAITVLQSKSLKQDTDIKNIENLITSLNTLINIYGEDRNKSLPSVNL